jgi:hypothetical protein
LCQKRIYKNDPESTPIAVTIKVQAPFESGMNPHGPLRMGMVICLAGVAGLAAACGPLPDGVEGQDSAADAARPSPPSDRPPCPRGSAESVLDATWSCGPDRVWQLTIRETWACPDGTPRTVTHRQRTRDLCQP